MDVRAAYESVGGDYDGVVRRLTSEVLVERFAGRFLEDQSFAKLKAALAEGDARGAFLAAHTLKGVCQNLGFTNLEGPASEICEALRGADEVGRAPELLAAVEEQYGRLVAALRA